MTTQVLQLKKTPCNGCRERKRKCTYEQPCARCAKSGIDCVYTVMQSPKDIEYMQELEYINQIESIQYQISCMEKEMAVLKLANETKQPPALQDYPSPVSMTKSLSPISRKSSTDLASRGNQPHFYDFTTKGDREHFIRHINEQANKTANSNVSLARPKPKDNDDKEPPTWEVSLKDGKFTINTHILSYTQLLNTIPNHTFKRPNQNRLPIPLDSMRMAQDSMIGTVISVMIWRKYAKTRYKSYTNFRPLQLLKENDRELTKVVPVEGLTTITLRLLSAYFQCGHYITFGIYVPGFIQGYMQGDILQSPAALALCSMICHLVCKHILEVLPKDALHEYAYFYFEQARELIEEKFDAMDEEAMVTFTFMAIYKLKQHDYCAAEKYLVMGERIYDVLKPTRAPDDIFFHRFYRSIYQCRSILELYVGVQDINRPRVAPQKLLELLDWQDHIPIIEGPGDTEQEKQFIRMRRHIGKLRKVINDGGKYAIAPDYPTFISVFGHHIEMGMRHWYRSVLPEEFQLSLPLFDDHIDDLQFFTVLEKECGDTPVKLIALVNVYNEYLVMAKSYLPRQPQEVQLQTEDLVRKFKELQYITSMSDFKKEIHKEEDEKTHHWLKLVAKMRYLRQYNQDHFTEEELEESDEDYFVRFIRALNPSKLSFDMPITHTSIKAALNMVRLTQFLMTRDYMCMFDVRWMFNAWEILTRAVRFKYQQPEDPGVTLDRIRANMIVCIQIMKNVIEYSSRNESTVLLDEMQEEFNNSFL